MVNFHGIQLMGSWTIFQIVIRSFVKQKRRASFKKGNQQNPFANMFFSWWGGSIWKLDTSSLVLTFLPMSFFKDLTESCWWFQISDDPTTFWRLMWNPMKSGMFYVKPYENIIWKPGYVFISTGAAVNSYSSSSISTILLQTGPFMLRHTKFSSSSSSSSSNQTHLLT